MRHPHATAPPSSGLALTNVLLLQRRLLAGKRKAAGADPAGQTAAMMTFGSTTSMAGAAPTNGALPASATTVAAGLA